MLSRVAQNVNIPVVETIIEKSVMIGPNDTVRCGSVFGSKANTNGDQIFAAAGDLTCDTEAAVCDLSKCSHSPSETDGESSCGDYESVAGDSGNRTSQIERL